MDEHQKKALLEKSELDFEESIGFSVEKWNAIKAELQDREHRATALINQKAPEFSVRSALSAERNHVLSDYEGKVLGLVAGCYTCPVFRKHADKINDIYRELKDSVGFLCIYVYEMHPVDGWLVQVNIKDDVLFKQPVTIEQRAAIARSWIERQNIEMDVGLDNMDNTIDAVYAGSPERLYVIDRSGVIVFKSPQGPFDDAVVDDWFGCLKMQAGLQA